MMDTCSLSACLNGFSSKSKSTTYYKYSLPKKLLIAISILIILTMCLMPTEARTVEQRRREQRKQKSPILRSEMIKISRKLRNTIRFFTQERRTINESRENRYGNPSWLPKINFVHIHNQVCRHSRNRTTFKCRVMNQIPKMYKSLMEYKVIFELLTNVTVVQKVNKFYDYMEARAKMFAITHKRLYELILQISESLIEMGIPVPEFDVNQMNLTDFQRYVDESICLRQDNIALRGYGNILNNWNFELKCPKGRNNKKKNDKCNAYEAQLKIRENQQSKNHKSGSRAVKNAKHETNVSQPRRRIKK